MKEGERIQEMFDRFNDILNGLKAFRKTYSNLELIRKILRALPKSWTSNKDAILEAKDLNALPLEELLGSLITHEMGLNEDEEPIPKIDKRRGQALKSQVIEEIEDEVLDQGRFTFGFFYIFSWKEKKCQKTKFQELLEQEIQLLE